MLIALVLLTVIHAPPAADSLPGTWKISGDVMGTAFGVTCSIKQVDAVLSGACVDDQGTSHPITGEVKEGKITFKYASDYQGQALTVVYAGTLASPSLLKGTVLVQPYGAGGTFSATPVPAKP